MEQCSLSSYLVTLSPKLGVGEKAAKGVLKAWCPLTLIDRVYRLICSDCCQSQERQIRLCLLAQILQLSLKFPICPSGGGDCWSSPASHSKQMAAPLTAPRCTTSTTTWEPMLSTVHHSDFVPAGLRNCSYCQPPHSWANITRAFWHAARRRAIMRINHSLPAAIIS